jgi:hypothetical protein
MSQPGWRAGRRRRVITAAAVDAVMIDSALLSLIVPELPDIDSERGQLAAEQLHGIRYRWLR